jgi:hypothetical protein
MAFKVLASDVNGPFWFHGGTLQRNRYRGLNVFAARSSYKGGEVCVMDHSQKSSNCEIRAIGPAGRFENAR